MNLNGNICGAPAVVPGAVVDLKAEWDRLSAEDRAAWEELDAARQLVSDAQKRMAAARVKHEALQGRLAEIGERIWPELRQG